MKAYTSFKIGGKADLMVFPRDERQVQAVIAHLHACGQDFFTLGNGSNLLVSDDGLHVPVIRIADCLTGARLAEEQDGTSFVYCAAGSSLSDLCTFAKRQSLAGLEFAWGIPGSVGGAVYMNAGAYGGEMKDVVVYCDCIDEQGNAHRLPLEDLHFGYRHSVFQEKQFCITGVCCRLEAGDAMQIKATMDDFMQRRKSKQPLEYPSAGSTFRRPAGNFAGTLIQSCGLKGYRVGGAQVSEKHAGFVINCGHATCEDVKQVIAHVQHTVQSKTGYDLKCEVKFIG